MEFAKAILCSVDYTKGRWNAVGDSHEKDTVDIVSTGSSLHVNGYEEVGTEDHTYTSEVFAVVRSGGSKGKYK
jgi:hypothetical protein